MRVLAGLAAALFTYLALIPGGLIYSTLNSACAGGACETSVVSRVFFVAIYLLSLAAVLGTVGLFAHYAATGSAATLDRLPRALAATTAVIGSVLFILFFYAFPLGGVVALVLAGGAYVALRLSSSDDPRPTPGPPPLTRPNGHGDKSGNGFSLPG